MIWALLEMGDGIAFYREIDGPPAGYLSYPWLVGIDPIRRAAHASILGGIGVGEASNTSARLINGNGQLSRLFRYQLPLKRRVFIYENTTELFSGVLMSIDLGGTAVFGIEV